MTLEENKNNNELKKDFNENQEIPIKSAEEETEANIESSLNTLTNNLESVENELKNVGGPEGIENTLRSMDANQLKELQNKITLLEKSYKNTKSQLADFVELSIPPLALMHDSNVGNKLKTFAGSLFLTGTGMGPLLVLTMGARALNEKIKLSLLKRKEQKKLNTVN